MAYNKKTPSMYAKGTADIWVWDIGSGDLVGYSNKLNTSNLSTSTNNGEIRAGLGAPVVMNIPDSSSFKGEVTAQDFSLVPRQLQTGGTLSYNGTAVYRENVTADSDGSLTVSRTPVSAYGEPSSNTAYACYVGDDGVNYQVNPTTKKVVNFTGVSGQSYCVMYFTEMASAQELTIPTTFAPSINRVMIKIAMYQENTGSDSRNSSLAGFLYIHIPRAQFVDGDAGVNGSQTENATTSWTFSALAYNEADVTCSECAMDNSVFGYMVYVPCGDVAQAVDGLVVIGGGVSVTAGGTAVQIPVKYIINNEIVQPQYTDLTYTSAATSTATVSADGKVTGVTAGSTKVTITITSKPSISTEANITVAAGS